MLWQKESNAIDALYIDLCKPILNKVNEFETNISLLDEQMLKSIERHFIPNKDNDFSLKLRQEGNGLFAKKKWDQAMDKYNRSLCFAENGSENVALAFANRSSCYLRMQMYEKCLIDIDLAKGANYPEHLDEKLVKRTSDCTKSIDEGAPAANREAKLSYEAHAVYPGMVNQLDIVSNTKYGRGVFTTKDIDVGETVLMEKVYFGDTYVRKYETCANCLKSNANLVPCKTCTFAMLCHDGCESTNFHRLECGIQKCPVDGNNFVVCMLIPIVRSVLMAMELFPHPPDLIKFVEDAVASDPMEIPTTIDAKSTYRAFLKTHRQELTDVEPHHIHFFYRSLLANTELAPHFSTEKYRRFFMHLILHHLTAFKSNKITNKRLIGDVLSQQLSRIDYVFEDEYMAILKAHFNHSCAPNIAFYCDNGAVIGKIIRPVKSGEQLFESSFGCLLGLTLDDRRRMGQSDSDFTCDCFRCASGVDDNTDFHIDSDFAFDIDYLYIRAKFSPNRSYPDEPQRKIVEEKSIRLLKEFGRNEWSYSLEYVMHAYIATLERSTTSPIAKYQYLTNIVAKPGLNYKTDMFEQHQRRFSVAGMLSRLVDNSLFS